MLYEGVPTEKAKPKTESWAPKHEKIFGAPPTTKHEEIFGKASAEEALEKDFAGRTNSPAHDAVFVEEARLRKEKEAEERRLAREPKGELVLGVTENKAPALEPQPQVESTAVRAQEGVKESKELSEEEESALLFLVTDKVHIVGVKLDVGEMDETRVAARVLAEALKNPDLKEQEMDGLVKEGYRRILGDRYRELAESMELLTQENGRLTTEFVAQYKKGLFNYSMMEGALRRMVDDYKKKLLPLHSYFQDEQYDFSLIEKYDKMLADGQSTKEYYENWEKYLQQKKAA